MKFFFELDINHINGKIILLDIDGTLTNDGSYVISERVVEKIQLLKRKNKIYLCSNKKNHNRNQKIADIVGVSYLWTNWRKPSKKIISSLSEHERGGPFVVIGDKFLTDGILAYRFGADFIKVKRITSGKESFLIKMVNKLDDCFNYKF